MAKSSYEYVKAFELSDQLLPNCWVVVRLDGKGFTKFCEAHGFEKPNDARALNLMDACAVECMKEFGDIRLAYGESDEYSFVFPKSLKLYNRRSSKLVSQLVSLFSGTYVRLWDKYFPATTLQSTPIFDGRAVCYPSERNLRDYLAWRQVDTHINNQYNTCYWALRLRSGKSPAEAQQALQGTMADAKNELLFSEYGINYNNLPAQFRKGSVVIRVLEEVDSGKVRGDGAAVVRGKRTLSVLHCDVIRDAFWQEHPELLL